MKAIGVDLWIEEESVRKNRFDKDKKYCEQCEFKSQEQLREELNKIVEKLKEDDWQIIDCENDRFRVLAEDEEANALLDKIFQMLPTYNSSPFELFSNRIECHSVSEDTPINRRPYWDENRWCGIEDFSQFHPAQDELLVLVKHWIKEYHRFNWLIEMEGGSFGRRDLLRYFDRPEARIARIEKLLGEEIVAKAINEAEEEFEKIIDDPVAFEIFKNGDHQAKESFVNALYSAHERMNSDHEKIVQRFIEEHSLDEKQTHLLRELARFDGSKDLSKILISLSDHHRQFTLDAINPNDTVTISS